MVLRPWRLYWTACLPRSNWARRPTRFSCLTRHGGVTKGSTAIDRGFRGARRCPEARSALRPPLSALPPSLALPPARPQAILYRDANFRSTYTYGAGVAEEKMPKLRKPFAARKTGALTETESLQFKIDRAATTPQLTWKDFEKEPD